MTEDASRDSANLQFANDFSGARLGKRKNTFADVSEHTPADAASPSHRKQIAVTCGLTEVVVATKPIDEVATTARHGANALETSMTGLAKAEAAHREGLAARDAHPPEAGTTKRPEKRPAEEPKAE